MKIAFTWRGSTSHVRDWRRSTSLDLWAPLFALPETDWLSLDVQADASPLLEALGLPNVHDCSIIIQDFRDSAAIVERCELVITVDTATVHLAGALGLPTWLLCYSPPEWRWGREGEVTPWYPSVKLYRQPEPDDWTSVFERVHADLSARIGTPAVVAGPLVGPSHG